MRMDFADERTEFITLTRHVVRLIYTQPSKEIHVMCSVVAGAFSILTTHVLSLYRCSLG
jgi:hypothetical protein